MESLWHIVAERGVAGGVNFLDPRGSAYAGSVAYGSRLGDSLELLRGKSVLLVTDEQAPTALSLVELDGVARRLVICTPDLNATQLRDVAATAGADAIVCDQSTAPAVAALPLPAVVLDLEATASGVERHSPVPTEWVLLTSGTTGTPKLVVHTLESLAGRLTPSPPAGGAPVVWSTFYDIRRYGGLQIFLRAVLGGNTLVLSSARETPEAFLARAGAAGITHISGTPSHWRRALMTGSARLIKPDYVRLSGEIADQAILDSLRATYPRARIAHAFASTEAGVAFDVDDGLAGFPAGFIAEGHGTVDLKVENGTLHIRSVRNAVRYLGAAPPLTGDDGYVDTGDLVERVDGRYQFRGRRGGVINVGGLKVFPEEVEAVLNGQAGVRMSLVRGRRNPITGALVVADVVLTHPVDDAKVGPIKDELVAACRRVLAPHKVPTSVNIVPSLALTTAGKLVRPHA